MRNAMGNPTAYWDEDGELVSNDHVGAVIIHHTALGVLVDASSFEEVAEAISDDYDTEIVRFDVEDKHGVEEDAECLIIWPGFDNYSQVIRTIERRLAEG